ncbi:MAG: RIP metalloprotease RseP [Burkholderiales bacterium]
MAFLQYAASFLFVLAVVIIIHELGHYWVARWCGVKVLRFSVGFGKVVLMTRRGSDQTEWALSAIPFGGYVKMLDGREGPVPVEDRHRAFDQQSVAKRMAIVVAGPLANFVLAIVLYAATYMIGFQEPRAKIGAPPEGTAAAQSGFREGDEIVAINGKKIRAWPDVRWELIDLAVTRIGAQVDVVDSRERAHTRTLDLSGVTIDSREGDPLTTLGLRIFRPSIAAVIGVLEAGRPAIQAGIQSGDRVVAVDGEPVADWQAFVNRVMASPGKPLEVDVVRNGERKLFDVTPAAIERNGQTIGRIGAGVREDPDAFKGLYVVQNYGLFEALQRATIKTWDMSIFSVRMMWKMLTGELSWRNLGGPVTIADYAGQSAALGWLPFVTFIALISISIGVLNLMPIPILDGGHLLYYLVELVKGRPLSDRILEYGQRVGFAILLVLMGFAFYNDISRLVAS